jgi:hypothetical protein
MKRKRCQHLVLSTLPKNVETFGVGKISKTMTPLEGIVAMMK